MPALRAQRGAWFDTGAVAPIYTAEAFLRPFPAFLGRHLRYMGPGLGGGLGVAPLFTPAPSLLAAPLTIAEVIDLLGVSSFWYAAAARDVVGSAAYDPILLVKFPAFQRTFATKAVPFLPEAEYDLVDLLANGVGTITRDLDELTDVIRLGGTSLVLPNENHLADTFRALPLANTPVELLLGFEGLDEGQYVPTYTGVVDRYVRTQETLTLSIIDSRAQDTISLNVPVGPPAFPSAPSGSLGAIIPLFIGVLIGAPTIQVDAMPSYATGFGALVLNHLRKNNAIVATDQYTAELVTVTGHPLLVIHLLFTPLVTDVFTVDVNATSPVVPLTGGVAPPPPPPFPGGGLMPNGGFETGVPAPWVAANGGVFTVANGGTPLHLTSAEKLTNPGFETGDFTGWGGTFAGAINAFEAILTASPHSGTYYAMIAGNPPLSTTLNQAHVFSTATRVHYSFWYKNDPAADASNGRASFSLVLAFGSSSSVILTQNLALVLVWTQVSGDIAISPGTLTLDLSVNAAVSSVPCFFDDVSLVEEVDIYSTQLAGTYRATLLGGLNTYGDAYVDIPTVVGEVYLAIIHYSNPRNLLGDATAPLHTDAAQAAWLLGTPGTPDLYTTRLLTASTYGRSPTPADLWWADSFQFIALATTTRVTLRSKYVQTSLATAFDELYLMVVPTGHAPGGGVPVLSGDAGENPVDVAIWMLGMFFPNATYDPASFDVARGLLADWKFSGIITNPGSNTTLLPRLALQCKSLLPKDGTGKYYWVVLDSSRAVDGTFTGDNIVDGSFSSINAPNDSIYSSFFVYYGTRKGGSTTPTDYAGVAYCTATATSAGTGGAALKALCADALAFYGVDHRYDFFADFIHDSSTAHFLLAWLVARYASRRDLHTWRSWLDAVPRRLGEAVHLDYPVLPNQAPIIAELVGHHYSPGAMTVELVGRTVAQDIPVTVKGCGAYSGAMLASLVVCYDFNEASGTRVDHVGGNTLAPVGPVGQVPAKLDFAASFTRASSTCLTGTLPDFSHAPWTLAVWVTITSYNMADDMCILANGVTLAAGNYNYVVLVRGSGQIFHFWGGAFGGGFGSTDLIALGTESLILIWRDATTLNLQINNGTLQTQAVATYGSAGNTIFNVGAIHNSLNFLDGSVDALQIWDRALTLSERLTIWNDGNGF